MVAEPSPVAPLADALSHLDALGGFVRLLLARCIQENKDRHNPTGTAQPRLAVAAAEIQRFLSEDPAASAASSQYVELTAAIERRWAELASAAQAAVAAGRDLPFESLRVACGLSRLDAWILAVLLAPELEPDFLRAYAYAWDDFTRKKVDVAFVASMMGRTLLDRERVRRALAPEAPLRRWRLVHLDGDAEASMLGRTIRVASRVVDFLRGEDRLDETVAAACRLVREPEARLEEVILADAIKERVARALRGAGAAGVKGAGDAPTRLLVFGAAGTGKKLVIEAAAFAAGRTVLRTDLPLLLADPAKLADRLLPILREAALRRAVVLFDGGTETGGDSVPRATAERFAELIVPFPGPIAFSMHDRPLWLIGHVPQIVEVVMPLPTLVERERLWRRALPDGVAIADEEAVRQVAVRYAFGGGSIERAAARAVAHAKLRDPDAPALGLEDLSEASRVQLTHKLGNLAQRIPGGFTWDDLILPADTMERIKEVIRFARHKSYLLESWGFQRKLPYGRGMSALFGGPPGTGKTMVAGLIARELGYELFRIDLAQIVNKYIGETEKNLARVFDEAEGSHAILFFDEADALFAKRTEVKSSVDRYANLEVNYLLQRMELYDGTTILATNLQQGLDEAFKRRVRFSIEFEMPDVDTRKLLWKSMFPKEAPLAPDVDWDLLAKKYEMAGGHIKKVAIRAALAAVDRGEPISNVDLQAAARLEYREMGRL